MKHYFKTMESPVGRLTLVATDEDKLAAVSWGDAAALAESYPSGEEDPARPVLREAARQLAEYFAGKRKSFDLTLDEAQGTAFQRKVWRALSTIPFGETRSYGEIARQIGADEAMRAVGAACGRNPIAIIVPCHRVIGANGRLTGFAGGLDIKAKLLAGEGRKDDDGASRAGSRNSGANRSESLRRQELFNWT
jgi:methylated-DNA-[protein]-cysteine S-methyltransferase